MIGNPSANQNAVECDVQLLVPAHDVADPELSIVIPALNEELTIAQFVDWCMEGLRQADVKGEILIVDSSTDSTPETAAAIAILGVCVGNGFEVGAHGIAHGRGAGTFPERPGRTLQSP